MAHAAKYLAEMAGHLYLAIAGNRTIPKHMYAEWADMLDRISAWFREQSK